MPIVFELRKNREYIEHVQRATLTTDEFGIEPTDGLFGSAAWWQKIASGELPVHTLSGVITKVFMGSMGDWPEFTMCSDAGEESSWTREANTKEQAQLYEVGRQIEIDYVIQHHRPRSWDRGAETKCVIEIRISDDA